jgi:hypothetical protein
MAIQTKFYMAAKDVPSQLKGIRGYTGQKYQVVSATEVDISDNYWSGGSRSYWGAVNLATGKSVELPGQNPLQDASRKRVTISPGVGVWEHTIFSGKDLGITFYLHPENVTKLLPSNETDGPTENEKIVLGYTKALKNTYAGETDLRFKNAARAEKISKEDWETAKTSCIQKGWITKAGAITNDGRNQPSKNYRGY